MKEVRIVNYDAKYRSAFKSLNKEWIDAYFVMEEADYHALDHPEENIINKGGYIFFAIIDGTPVGVCALKKSTHDGYDYELSKMGVNKDYQGYGIGRKLATKVIAKARELDADNIYIESNTKLITAIKLYEKLGFVEVQGPPSPFERSNIQMELKLK